MQIIICDDDLVLAQTLAQHAQQYLQAHALDAPVCVCSAFDTCLPLIPEPDTPVLFFLDICLQEQSGFDLAHQIRLTHPHAEIAFVTAYPQYMPDAFACKPLAFLTKPFCYAQVEEILDRFRHYSALENHVFSLSLRDQVLQIPYAQIAYFESRLHQISCVLLDGTRHYFPGKLDALETQLHRNLFIRCHKSYLIRLGAIRSLNRSEHCFLLSNDEKVPISRAAYRDCADAFLRQMTP